MIGVLGVLRVLVLSKASFVEALIADDLQTSQILNIRASSHQRVARMARSPVKLNIHKSRVLLIQRHPSSIRDGAVGILIQLSQLRLILRR